MKNRALSTAITALAGARLMVQPWTYNAQGCRIYLDSRDHRAWRLARHKGALDLPAILAWQRLNRIANPDMVIDIGANYGEVVLSATYLDAEVHAVEANPRVARFLQRSIVHANLPATVHEIAASRDVGASLLHLDPRSSGLSSLEARTSSHTVEVRTSTIDKLVAKVPQRCLFKIDVEGHEGAVLDGMSNIMRNSQWWGLVEANNLDQISAPYTYAVRSQDGLFQAYDNVKHDSRNFTKDVVISKTPITGADIYE